MKMKILVPNPIIREVSKDVPQEEIKDAIKIARKMIKLCKKNTNCVGLSAIQVGIPQSIFVAKIGNKWRIFINPNITKRYNETHIVLEGCMSFPHKHGYVKRHKKIKLEYLDVNGEKKEEIFKRFQAAIIQHECDHCNGIACVDKFRKNY